MNKSFETRLEALEKARGIEHYVLLLGDDCDAFDAAIRAGEQGEALEILRRSNPYADAAVLGEVVERPGASRDITLIRAEYGEPT